MSSSPAFTILVVDENPSSRRFVDLALGPDGIRVLGAQDGYAALEAADREQPNVALVAMGLLGPGGQSVAEQLTSRGLAVATMTGSLESNPDDATGATVLRKPLQVSDLRAMVAAFRQRRAIAVTPPPPQEFGTPLAIQDGTVTTDSDPVDAWLSTADSMFGEAPPRWQRLSLDGDVLNPFARDLESFRKSPRREGLRFSRHRTAHDGASA
jgi:DNA-binding response OmpR family regulator